MPVYCIVDLWTQPGSRSSASRQRPEYAVIPSSTLWTSVSIGYIIPSILMCWKTENYSLHQNFVAVWQLSPPWILLSQLLIPRTSWIFPPSPPATHLGTGSHALQELFLSGQVVAGLVHIAAMAMVLVANSVPHLLSAPIAVDLGWQNVFVPPRFWDPEPVESITHGMHVFLQWDQYTGSVALLTWLWLLTIEARERAAMQSAGSEPSGLLRVFATTLLLGPGATAMKLLSERTNALETMKESTPFIQAKQGNFWTYILKSTAQSCSHIQINSALLHSQAAFSLLRGILSLRMRSFLQHLPQNCCYDL